MKVVEINNKEQLNKFVANQKHSQFLQAWQWGEFHKKVSGKVWRLGIENNSELTMVATLIKKTLPMGKSYFYCPRGPVGQTASKQTARQLEILFNKIGELAKDEGVMFLRFEPLSQFPISNFQFPISKTIDVQPSQTLVLNLSKGEGELLKEMHQKTRYNIRLAEKRGVKISEVGRQGLEEFWRLMSETSGRDDFRLHGRNYYEEMIKINSKFIKLFLAKYKGKVIAANIVSFFGDSATYMHGASSNEDRNVMAPYLLQWQAIKLACELGIKYYDFYGIDEKKWPGVTRFKKGFGGREKKYPGTFDLIFDKGWYNIYKMVRKVRRTF